MSAGTEVAASGVSSTRKRPLRVAMLGHFGSGNLGNEGSLEVVTAAVRQMQADVDVCCISVEPDTVERQHGLVGVPFNWRFRGRMLTRLDRLLLHIPSLIGDVVRTTWHARRFDVIVVPGTGILDDFGAGPRGMPYGLLKWALLARLLGVEYWLVSIGAGPIHHPVSRWLMKSAARLAHYRSYRDEISRDFMIGIGFDAARDPIFPDVAFGLPAPTRVRSTEPRGRPLTVGLGVMTYYGWRQDGVAGRQTYDRYIAKVAEFAAWVLGQGHSVRLLTGEASDERAVADLLGRLAIVRGREGGPSIVHEAAGSLHDLMRQIAGTDVVVATRFHNVVCALKVGRPTISLSYARKNDALLAEVGLTGFSQPIEVFDVEQLKWQFTRLLEVRTEREPVIRVAVTRFEKSLVTQYADLKARLAGVGGRPVPRLASAGRAAPSA